MASTVYARLVRLVGRMQIHAQSVITSSSYYNSVQTCASVRDETYEKQKFDEMAKISFFEEEGLARGCDS